MPVKQRRRWKRTIFERFWEKVFVPPDKLSCWEWQAGLNSDGYGIFAINSRPNKTHRVVWELTRGAIADGLHVLHNCDNRRCVNPDHLYLGTHAQNMRDMFARNRRKKIPFRHGENGARAKLTWSKARAIRELRKLGVRQVDVAKYFGISKTTVRHIVEERAWRSSFAPI